MSKEEERRIFSQQCFSILEQFRNFDAREAAKKARRRRVDAEVQERTHQERVKAVLDGLEKQAIKVRRKTAFKGLRKIFENGQ